MKQKSLKILSVFSRNIYCTGIFIAFFQEWYWIVDHFAELQKKKTVSIDIFLEFRSIFLNYRFKHLQYFIW